MMKKFAATALAAAVVLGSTVGANAMIFVDNRAAYSSREAVEATLILRTNELENLREKGGSKSVGSTTDKNYAFSLSSADIGEIPKGRTSYKIKLERIFDYSSAFDKAVGQKTPKYVFKMSGEDNLPTAVNVTAKDTSFMPGSTLYAYHLTEQKIPGDGIVENIFTQMGEAITVDENCNFTFKVQDSGYYLISSQPITNHTNYLEDSLWGEFERTQFVENLDDLLTYLNEDPDGYFTQLWKVPAPTEALEDN